MNTTRFDTISKRFAQHRLSRRQTLAAGGAGLAAGLLATAHAQEGTPVATPAHDPNDPHPSADRVVTHPEYLFVQPFDAGTWVPKDGAEGTYTLTLTGAAAQTAYFSDRPERDVGLAPTQDFLDTLGFTPENPPNAALVAQDDSGEQDILVVELLNPAWDGDGTLTYDARVLADYGERGLADLARQQTDYELAESFGAGSLFIDDCPDSSNDACIAVRDGNWFWPGPVTSGNCWNSSYTGDIGCSPCESYAWLCDATYPDVCQGNCADDIERCGWPGCSA